MKGAPVDVVAHGVIALGIVLWVVALIRGRALEWFEERTELPEWALPATEFLIFLCAFFVSAWSAQLLVSSVFALDLKTEPLPARSMLFLGYAGQLAWLAAGLLLWAPRFLRPTAGKMRWMPAMVAGVTGMLLFLPAGELAGQISKLLLPLLRLSDAPQDAFAYVRNIGSVAEFFAWFGMIVILVPIVEEFVFRGIIYRFLRARCPDGIAIVLSAVAFSLMHRNALAFLPLAAFGVALCLAYRYTGRLVTPIVMHAIFNLQSLVYAVLVDKA